MEKSDIETIKAMRDDWARAAKTKFPGGRVTEDEEQPAATANNDELPDSAFQAR